MDKFFDTLKKGLVAMLFVIVGFAMTYVPQIPSSQVQPVEAGPLDSTLPMQIVQNASALAGNAINTITAGATGSLWLKENVLDGIGWAIAKSIVSGMVRSLINWINSGFQGAPSFVTDIKGFMLNIADEEIGRIISDLGDVGSFICSPFRLDVQISIATQYANARGGGSTNAPTCTLTGVIDNIEGFINGTDPGNGLSDWLTITSSPETYTPYGATLAAEATVRARLINAKGETLTEVNWGDGFLSQKICQVVGGTGEQDCSISKPGKIIQEALTFNLDSGRQSLVQADEINEIIVALFSQLANQAITGVAGLLGLSGGTGYSYSGYSGGDYLSTLSADSGNLVTTAADRADSDTNSPDIISALDTEIGYRERAIGYRDSLEAFVIQANNTLSISVIPNPGLVADRNEALDALDDINDSIAIIDNNIANLMDFAFDYNAAPADQKIQILINFTSSNSTTDRFTASNQEDYLDDFISRTTAFRPIITPTTSLEDLINDVRGGGTTTLDTTNSAWIAISNATGIPIR